MTKMDKEEEAMELRIATIIYKRSRKKEHFTCEKLSDEAGLPDGRFSLPKFLAGEIEYFKGLSLLRNHLEEKGFYPLKGYSARGISYSSISSFFSNQSADLTYRMLGGRVGKYECFQWSSTDSGKVIISQIDIDYSVSSDYLNVTERQFYRRRENYEGCGFYSYGKLILSLREEISRRPKFIICDEPHTEYISGLYLKASTIKSMHVSGIYMARIAEDIVPRIEYIDNISNNDARRHLEEPLTPFYLTSNPAFDKLLKHELQKTMRKFHAKLEKDEN